MAQTIDWDAVAHKLGYAAEKELWEGLYLIRGFSIKRIAEQFDVSHTVVRSSMLRCGLRMRSRGGPHRARQPLELLVLEEHVERDGVAAVAKRMQVTPAAVYKALKRAAALRAEGKLPPRAPVQPDDDEEGEDP